MIKIYGKFSKNILRMKDREFYVFYQEGESSYDDIIKVNTIMKTEGLIPEEYLVLRRHYYVLAMVLCQDLAQNKMRSSVS